MRVKLDLPPAPADRDVLRELALQIKWDGETEPSVWAPLGDFFGTAGVNNYRSLPLGHTGDGWWYCNWYMPFAKGAQVELINDGKTARTVTFEVTHAPLSRPIAQLARFHAKWHRDAFLPREPERAIDWPILKTEGAGRFVGVMLHVWNPRGGWWGEGDEKFFVDGEKFPSTFGTGSEDYFGYAWCCPRFFQNASTTRPTTTATTAATCPSTAGKSPTTCPSSSPSKAALRSITPTRAPRSTPRWPTGIWRPAATTPISPGP